MIALSIRQPYAELILRGIKTVEYRSRSTNILGRRFYIYAAKGMANVQFPNQNDQSNPDVQGRRKSVISSDNLTVPSEPLPEWMIELAKQVKLIEPGAILPRGVIVGSAVIEKCVRQGPAARGMGQEFNDSGSPLAPDPSPLFMYEWHLTDVQRATRLRKPTGHPQPVWFRPF